MPVAGQSEYYTSEYYAAEAVSYGRRRATATTQHTAFYQLTL
jgi:hypothetical protein